jgi:hypothetical protein
MHRVDIVATLEAPPLPDLADDVDMLISPHPDACGNILKALPRRIIYDLFVIHPLSILILSRAATTAGLAVSHRDQ